MLERILLDNAGNRKPHLAFLDANVEQISGHPLPSFISSAAGSQHNDEERSPQTQTPSLAEADVQGEGRRKRRRLDDAGLSSLAEENGLWMPPLPSLPLLEAVVEAHFHTVHHWVPILHETRFRAKLKDLQERRRLAVVLHAILSSSIKYVDYEEFGMTPEEVERQIRVSRKAVLFNAMDSLSIENTEALIFLAFDYVSHREPLCLPLLVYSFSSRVY